MQHFLFGFMRFSLAGAATWRYPAPHVYTMHTNCGLIVVSQARLSLPCESWPARLCGLWGRLRGYVQPGFDYVIDIVSWSSVHNRLSFTEARRRLPKVLNPARRAQIKKLVSPHLTDPSLMMANYSGAYSQPHPKVRICDNLQQGMWQARLQRHPISVRLKHSVPT